MSIFTKLRQQTHDFFVKRALNNHQVNHESVDFERAVNIGILFDASELADREVVLKFAKKLKNDGKKVKLLGYLTAQSKNENFIFQHFNKSDLDWALRPKSEPVQLFMEQAFDILMNLSNQPLPPLEYVAAFSHAKFRVGPATENTFCYELMVEASSNNDLKAFLQQIMFFLTKMKTTHEPII